MGMLTKDDLRQIGDVVDKRLDVKMDEKLLAFEERIIPKIVDQVTEKVVAEVVAEVGEMIEENVLPQFDRLEKTLVSKAYLDDKLADLRGEFFLKRRGLA